MEFSVKRSERSRRKGELPHTTDAPPEVVGESPQGATEL